MASLSNDRIQSYELTGEKNRHCLLIRNIDSDDAKQMATNLKSTLELFRFNVKIENFKGEEMMKGIADVSEKLKSQDCDVFILAILAYGNKHEVCGVNQRSVAIEDIEYHLSNYYLNNFAGKPRLLLYLTREPTFPMKRVSRLQRDSVRQFDDMLTAWLNDSCFKNNGVKSYDLDAFCEAMKIHGKTTPIHRILQNSIGAEVSNSGFKNLVLDC